MKIQILKPQTVLIRWDMSHIYWIGKSESNIKSLKTKILQAKVKGFWID